MYLNFLKTILCCLSDENGPSLRGLWFSKVLLATITTACTSHSLNQLFWVLLCILHDLFRHSTVSKVLGCLFFELGVRRRRWKALPHMRSRVDGACLLTFPKKGPNHRAGEIVQWLGELPGQPPAPVSGRSLLLVTLVPGNQNPSSGLQRHLHTAHHTHTQTHNTQRDTHTRGHTINNGDIFFFKREGWSNQMQESQHELEMKVLRPLCLSSLGKDPGCFRINSRPQSCPMDLCAERRKSGDCFHEEQWSLALVECCRLEMWIWRVKAFFCIFFKFI